MTFLFVMLLGSLVAAWYKVEALACALLILAFLGMIALLIVHCTDVVNVRL